MVIMRNSGLTWLTVIDIPLTFDDERTVCPRSEAHQSYRAAPHTISLQPGTPVTRLVTQLHLEEALRGTHLSRSLRIVWTLASPDRC